MQDAKELLPLVNYQPQWIVIGSLLILGAVTWVGFIFWHTRKRPQKTVASLSAQKVANVDIAGLKKKYLGLIDQIAQESQQKAINARQAHQKLSILVRLFVFEATGYQTQVMTLADIEKRNLPKLQTTISALYPNEFSQLLTGSVEDALGKARDMVTTW
jgi:flagellar basal body-associated protein FliL